MPTYEYRCANGHVFEVSQSMADDPISECEVCGAPVERVYHPPAVHYKGSGFYTTDYAKENGAKSDSDSDKKSGDSDTAKKSEEVREEKERQQQVLGLVRPPALPLRAVWVARRIPAEKLPRGG